ncbi:MAG: hypothetical protein K2X27_15435 [Candidatus Obscuribacterales bacterium]|nr:hypothetical protein [Candidatus Obscuribacterales bacterium]
MIKMVKEALAILARGKSIELINDEWSAVRARLQKVEFLPDTYMNPFQKNQESERVPEASQVKVSGPRYIDMLPEIARRPLCKRESVLHGMDRQALELARLEQRSTQRLAVGSLQEAMTRQCTLMR